MQASTARLSAAQVDALVQQAVRLQQQGQLLQARTIYEQVLASLPDHLNALHLLGVICLQTGQFARAAEVIARAIRLFPGNAQLHSNLGIALERLGQLEPALASYERAIQASPGHADAYVNRGNVERRLGRLQAALTSYERAIDLRPALAEASFNRGFVQEKLGRREEAILSYRAALAQRPDYAEAHGNLATVLMAAGQPEDALGHLDRLVALRPDLAPAHFNRGIAQQQLQRFEAALASYGRAIELQPGFADAHVNCGNVLKNLGRALAARASYERAVAADPGHADAHWNLAWAALLLGDFERGWAENEWRWSTRDFASLGRHFTQPQWRGQESLAGRTILLHAEQGLGDTLQFSRYGPLVAAQGARVIVEAQATLLPLLRSLAGVDRLIARGEPLPDFDLHCPLLSLPLAFGTRLETIPATPGYLQADADAVAAWAQRLGSRTRPRAGLVWRSQTGRYDLDKRSVALGELLGSLPPGLDYFSLQKEPDAQERALLHERADIRHLGDELLDFGDTAAACAAMDLVLSVDTSVAHLGGALGRPTWVLLPHAADWRWLLDRSDSPWYPTTRLYRQPSPGQWGPLLAGVHRDLSSLAGAA